MKMTVEKVMSKLIGMKFKDAENILARFEYGLRRVSEDGLDIEELSLLNRANVVVNDDDVIVEFLCMG